MNNNNEPKPKRKIKLINRSFQYRLMAKFILVNIFILILFGGMIYIFFQSEISANLASAHATYRSVSQMLLPIVLTLSLLNILFTSLIIAWAVVYWSHKIAGPLYRFNEALKEIAGGNLAPLTRIREDDQLKELSQTLGKVTGQFSRDVSGIKNKIEEMKQLLTQYSVPEELRTKLEELENIAGKYRLAGA